MASSPALLIAAAAIALAGCSSGESSESSTPATGATETTTEAVPTTTATARTTTPTPPEPLLSSAEARALDDFARSAGGSVGIAVEPLGAGPVSTAGDLSTGRAWSTIKVPLLVALIHEVGGLDGLTASDRANAAAALERSDNAAAAALFDRLEGLTGGLDSASAAIQARLRVAGDTRTAVNTKPPADPQLSTYGQTIWSARAADAFFAALARGCELPDRETAYVLGLMGRVIADQRWGFGDAGLPASTALAFKGGWGPEPDGRYLVRQSAIVGGGSRGYAVTVIALADTTSGDSFEAGTRLVSEAAGRVAALVGDPGARPAAPCPGSQG